MSSETAQESEQETAIDSPEAQESSRPSGRREARRAPRTPERTQERLEVSSGKVLIIDQFMLANQQFTSPLAGLSPEDGAAADTLKDAASRYGGCVLNMDPGSYLVLRDPELSVIALSAENGASEAEDTEDDSGSEEDSFDFAELLDAKGNLSALGQVFVDTRCLVIVDAKVATDADAVTRYREFREGGKDKKARDFIRSIGGAVRYGFNRQGDELGVFNVAEKGLIALWPDVIDHN